ncbi:DUF296 domain-containing protein [Candidatus Micrarchaeota archaeon]|nr:DUF296 domain-containing protein [Candidatus Micrarchaeota archaeon]
MEYKKTALDGNGVVIRLKEGEDINEAVKQIAKKENILSGIVTGLGAAKLAEIAHWNTKKKKYSTKTLKGMLEIVSLNGNITRDSENGEPICHLHIILGKEDFSVIAGHLVRSEVNPTCEIFILPLKTKIERKFDTKTGLKLQKL